MDERHRHLAVGPGAAAPTLTATGATPAPATTAARRYGWGGPPPAGAGEWDHGSEADPAVPDRAEMVFPPAPDHLRGFLGAEEWFGSPGGAAENRACAQGAPSPHQTIRPGGCHGDGLRGVGPEAGRARLPHLPDTEGAR
ncbi:hypothetical protein GTU99_10325 [Streptomyces sp. PRKS01-65]|nr:hypothetical protein [Streptomyces harenosi]NEY32582.1 hypothetical protein [Streptomyces harenosi]